MGAKLLVKNAKQRLSASDVLNHPWFNNNNTNELTTPAKLRRNNSTHELSLFAESASAVNRVVLQHMSRDTWERENQQENILGLSPPQDSLMMQRRKSLSQKVTKNCSYTKVLHTQVFSILLSFIEQVYLHFIVFRTSTEQFQLLRQIKIAMEEPT